ncbi:MAG: thioredoxin family protein [Planctomycetes bacterium]|nr:thioredoxin family protein [Planctomycetota bacterium]
MRTRRVGLMSALLVFFLPIGLAAGEITFGDDPFGTGGGKADSLFGDLGSAAPLFPKPGSGGTNNALAIQVVPETSAIVPDTPFRVAVILDHPSGSYSYWTNPGGPGVGTRVKWNLPDGFTVSGPEWPIPERYENGGMVFYIYKGKTALVYTVTPPSTLKPGEAVELAGDIDTQICTPRSCTPVKRSVQAKVVAAAEPGSADPAVGLALRTLPVRPTKWRLEASRSDNSLAILLHPESGANPDPGTVYYFDNDPASAVDSQQPQRFENDGNSWRLTLPVKPDSLDADARLTGILHSEKGWLDSADAPEAFTVDVPITLGAIPPGGHPAVSDRTMLLLLFAFLGGLLLNVMPCVFPVIGLKIMGFAKQAHKDRRAIFLHGLSYTAGVLICFWTLAFLVITMGRGWGAQLQSEWFLLAMVHLFLIMSLNMAGVFEVGTSVAGAGQGLTGREGLKRSFFTGLLATLTSTPCSAPFLGTALAYALSLSALLSLGVFTLMGLGFSFPYLALSLFPSWLKRLPKPGQWMETFRQAMAFPLFGTTAYLFWTMEAMMDEWRFLMLLFGLVMTAMACWLYGKRQKAQIRRPRAAKGLMAIAVVSLACGLWLGMPKGADDLEWREWSPELVSRLRKEGRTVFVDFTARWCATCQVNKRVYSNAELRDLLKEKDVALLKADWTLYDERITSTLRDEFDKAAVPVNVIYRPGEKEPTVLPDILTVENVGQVLRELP